MTAEPQAASALLSGPSPSPGEATSGPAPWTPNQGLTLMVEDGLIVYANSACRTLFAVMVPGGIVGKRFASLFSGDEPEAGVEWEGALRTHEVVTGGKPGLDLSAVVREASWDGRPALGVQFDPPEILDAVLHGIERRETQLDLALGSASGGLWNLWLDPDDPTAPPDQCEISDSLQCMFGYEPGEMEATVAAFRGHILPEDRPLMDRAMGAYMAGETDRHELEYRVRRVDGEIRWFRSCGRILFDEECRPVRWVGVEWDITERCQREQEVRRTNRKFAALFRLSPAPIALLTAAGHFVEVNASFLRHLGREREQVIGHRDRDLGVWRSPRDRRSFILQVAREGRVEGMRVWMINASGGERAMELSAEQMTLDGSLHVLLVGRDVTAESEAEEKLRTMAHYDQLTGLPNRALFEKRLETALDGGAEDGVRTAILFIDLDRLKTVNDTYGHGAGDELIEAVAGRLHEALRPADVLARLGGDEMVVVARIRSGQDAEERARKLGSRLQAAVARPLELSAGATVVPDASIGICLTPDGERGCGEELVRRADMAMYRVKDQGGGGVALYDPVRDVEELADPRTRLDLFKALEEGQLDVCFQPLVHLDRLGLWGAEALLRWDHPTEGRIGPTEFIPLAEQTRLIIPMGAWVLVESCRRLARWRRDGIVDDAFVLSVNVSAHQLAAGGFVEEVDRILGTTGVPAHCLQLEITERVALEASDVAHGLRDLGLRLAIDDFGRGYASLSYLRELPVDLLKIDRSFIREIATDPVSGSLVRSILFLADRLNLDVIAEGIETAEQLRLLREMGCGLGQGFLFAEALSDGQLAEVVRGRRQALPFDPAPAIFRTAAGGGRGDQLLPAAPERSGSDGGGSSRSALALASSSSLEKGLARNGSSGPRMPRALSASSR